MRTDVDPAPSPIRGMRQFQAYALLLMDRGHWPKGSVSFADEAGRDFAREVLQLNPNWKPGETPVLPNNRPAPRVSMRVELNRRSAVEALSSVKLPNSTAGPRRAATTSRARPRGRGATARAGASRDGPDDPDEPPLARPEPGDAGLDVVAAGAAG
jgi:hypothetical protein